MTDSLAAAEPALPETAPTGTGAPLSGILKSGGWSVFAQVVPLAINLVLTPYVIHGFGIDRYGLFLLVVTINTLLGSFDGGIISSAQRYFAVFAGRDDKRESTRLLVTLVTLISALGGLLLLVMWFIAPHLAVLLHMPHGLRSEAVFMLRCSAVILAVVLLRGLPTAVLQAHHRFALINITYTASYGIYALGIILTVENHWGLRGAALTILAQQLAAAFLLVPRSLRYLARSGIGFFRRTELQEFLVFSTKVQVVGWATLFLQEISSVVIGAVLPVRNVAVFNAGASFATQLRGIPINVIPPIQTTLGHALGRGGEAALVTEARRLQRFWIVGITGWCAAAGPACYFGIRAWLGPQFHASGIIALAMMVGSVFYLSTKVLTTTLTVSGRPGFEARYCIAMVVVNLLLLPAGVALGPIGVVTAAVIAQAASAAYLGRIVRREWSASMAALSKDVPLVASAVAVAVVVLLELAIHPIVRGGAVGLLTCALPGIPGLLVYGRLTLDGRTRAALRHRASRRLLRRGHARDPYPAPIEERQLTP